MNSVVGAIRVGLVPLVRPLFRGARMGLAEASLEALKGLEVPFGFSLDYVSPPVGEAGEAHARAAEAGKRYEDGSLDLLLVQHVTFSSGDVIAPFLDLPMPLGLWALPEAATQGPLPQNALCGLNHGLSLPTARTIPVKWLYGNAEDSQFRARLGLTLRALRGRRALARGRILWVGGTAPGFSRLEALPDLPLRVDRAPLDDLFGAVDAIGDDDVSAALSTLDEPRGLELEALRRTVRLELAIERLADGYDGVALRCWPEVPERMGTMACAAFARLSDRGLALACEGDAAAVASMIAVAAVSGAPAITLDLSHAAEDGLLFWHCGNAARAWARAGETILTSHFNRGLPAVRDMRLEPGPVGGLRFLEGRRAAVYGGAVTGRADGYDGVSGWIGRLRWAGQEMSPAEFLAGVLNHRLPHHLVWGRGEAEAALIELCAWLGCRVLPPDPETLLLRWRGLEGGDER